MFAEHSKELSPDQLRRVTETSQTGNPLFLRLVIEVTESCTFNG